MRIAILVTGQPRFLEEGAWWYENKVFTSNNIQVDYYCYFWDDGSPDLKQRIENTFNPVRYHIADYNSIMKEFIRNVKTYNANNSTYLDLVPDNIRNSILFETDEQYISEYSFNFFGQYLAINGITNMTGNLEGMYDIVIRTRSDTVLNNISEHEWLAAFSNMHRNPVFRNKIMAPWLYIESGTPHIGDFCFISLPSPWYNYSKNLKEHCFKLVTEHRPLFYDLKVSDYKSILQHWVWMKTSAYSNTNWLSFSVTWPTAFDSTVLRNKHNMKTMTFKLLKEDYENFNKTQNA